MGGRSPGFWNVDDDEVSIPKLAPKVLVGTFDEHWEVDGEVGYESFLFSFFFFSVLSLFNKEIIFFFPSPFLFGCPFQT